MTTTQTLQEVRQTPEYFHILNLGLGITPAFVDYPSPKTWADVFEHYNKGGQVWCEYLDTCATCQENNNEYCNCCYGFFREDITPESLFDYEILNRLHLVF